MMAPDTMHKWLKPVRESLDEVTNPVRFFFRNDDAGWAEQRLFALLDSFEQHETAIDLAVIPQAIVSGASDLYKRVINSKGMIGVHQHGFIHDNHQLQGRKCEFGSDRTFIQQWVDIRNGRDLLEKHFSGYVDAIFTPPWNRCTQDTVDVLVNLQFSALSRDSTAPALQCDGIEEIPVDIDWFKKYQGIRLSHQELGNMLAARILSGAESVGIMLHHQIMDAQERNRLEQLLALIKDHPMADCQRMRDLLKQQMHYENTGNIQYFPGVR